MPGCCRRSNDYALTVSINGSERKYPGEYRSRQWVTEFQNQEDGFSKNARKCAPGVDTVRLRRAASAGAIRQLKTQRQVPSAPCRHPPMASALYAAPSRGDARPQCSRGEGYFFFGSGISMDTRCR